jgi:hypothetical protein
MFILSIIENEHCGQNAELLNVKAGGTCSLTLHFEWLKDVTYLAGFRNNVCCRKVVLLVLWEFVSLENVCACLIVRIYWVIYLCNILLEGIMYVFTDQ